MNAYFQLIGETDGTKIMLVPPTDGGRELQPGDVIDYLNFHKLGFNLTQINEAVLGLTEKTVLQLNKERLIPINEEVSISIADDKMTVTGIFW